jgi:hypothetical protein
MRCRRLLSASARLCVGGAAFRVLRARRGARRGPAADVRRSLTLLNVVGEEYREGVVDGQVVLPIEYEEARNFLERGARTVGARGARGRQRRRPPQFAQVRAAMDAKVPTDQVRASSNAARRRLHP